MASMNRTARLSALLAAGLIVFQCGRAAVAEPGASAPPAPAIDFSQPGEDGLIVKKNIVFRKIGSALLKGDLYRPAGDAALPIVIVIHGGGFMFGDKDMEHYTRISREVAAGGYVVFNVNYRLIQNGGVYPESVKDVKCAVRWARANAAQIGGDPTKIGAIGGSAGGYLATMLAATANHPDFEPDCDYGADPSTEIKAAVVYFGLTDIRADAPHTASFKMLLPRFLGEKNGGSAELQAEASPVTYAAGAAPLLLLHGTKDTLVEHEQSVALCARAAEAGRVCELHLFEGAEHAFITYPDAPASVESSRLTFEFFGKYLGD